MPADWTRAIDPLYLGLGLVLGLVFALMTLISVAIRDPAQREFALKIIETIVVTALSAILARAFVSILLSLGGDRPAAVAFVWFFFLGIWGLIADILALIFGGETFLNPEGPLLAAFVVGGIIGAYDGLYRTRKWLGWGTPTWIVDVTWGLALGAHAAFMLLFNRLWGKHEPEIRANDHVFRGGFRILPDFAFTQGHVISNWSGDAKLLAHERIHVLQNRLFGPIFIYTYVCWLVLLVLPGLIFDIAGSLLGWLARDRDTGATRYVKFGDGLMWYPYYNNPWEFWAYQYGGWRDPAQVAALRWPGWLIIVLTVILAVPAFYVFYLLASAAFLS